MNRDNVTNVIAVKGLFAILLRSRGGPDGVLSHPAAL